MSYTPSVEHVVDAKHSLFVLKIFAILRLRRAHVRKDTRLSPLFQLGGAWERGLGTRPGNEAWERGLGTGYKNSMRSTPYRGFQVG